MWWMWPPWTYVQDSPNRDPLRRFATCHKVIRNSDIAQNLFRTEECNLHAYCTVWRSGTWVQSNEAVAWPQEQAKHELRNIPWAFSKSVDKAAATRRIATSRSTSRPRPLPSYKAWNHSGLVYHLLHTTSHITLPLSLYWRWDWDRKYWIKTFCIL
jgi:hypothetical protein